MINPAKLLKYKHELSAFVERHPKFIRYLEVVKKDYVKEGSVVDVTVTEPEGKKIHANLRLNAEDVKTLTELEEFLGML